jgi:hypothetical protein
MLLHVTHQKRCIAALLAALLLICAFAITIGAEESTQPTEKRISLVYNGDEVIDLTKHFEHVDGAVYTCAPNSGVEEHFELNGTDLVVKVPGGFRIEQDVNGVKQRVMLFVQRELRVTVKDQVLPIGQQPISAAENVVVEGLIDGHTLLAVELEIVLADVIGDHDRIAIKSITVMAGDEDVSNQYEYIKNSTRGIWHSYSGEWGNENGEHFHTCAALECELRIGAAPHDFKADCDGFCDVCLLKRDAAEHSWSSALITKEATEESVGERIYICRYCDAVRTEVIPLVEPVSVGVIIAVVAICAAVFGVLAYFAVRALMRDPAGKSE